PAAGYIIADVVVDGVSQGPIRKYRFDAISQHHTIHAEFTQVHIIAAIAGSPSFDARVDYPSGGTARMSVLADLDGDGNLDLITTLPEANAVSIRSGDGAGRFGSARTLATGKAPLHVVVDDFNRDG